MFGELLEAEAKNSKIDLKQMKQKMFERLLLTESEAHECYSPPPFTANDQRFFFALDNREQEACKKVRQRRSRCMLTLLLGYFKAKPEILISRYHQVKADLGTEIFNPHKFARDSSILMSYFNIHV